mgnify:CR=1 FL=1
MKFIPTVGISQVDKREYVLCGVYEYMSTIAIGAVAQNSCSNGVVIDFCG